MREAGHRAIVATRSLGDRLGTLVARRSEDGPAVVFRELGEYGGLGNQLWEIATTIGIARRRRTRARFSSWAYQSRFSVPDEFFEAPDGAEIDAVSLAPHITEPFRHYLQDYGLFRGAAGEVRKYFSPSSATLVEFEGKFAELLRMPNKTALHVRRGDYLKWPTHHPLPPIGYYRRAVEILGESNILVFSDDIPWCEENLRWARPASFVRGNADYEDLFLMSRCEHHILANSSFSWWGTFLSGDRRPIYPTRWYGPTFRDLGIDQSLMILKGWIGVDA